MPSLTSGDVAPRFDCSEDGDEAPLHDVWAHCPDSEPITFAGKVGGSTPQSCLDPLRSRSLVTVSELDVFCQLLEPRQCSLHQYPSLALVLPSVTQQMSLVMSGGSCSTEL